MSIVVELSPETEVRLRDRAALEGRELPDLLRELAKREAERLPLPTYTATEILRLPWEVQERLLAAAAAHTAPLYEADLALPAAERELTAFTALDGVDPIYDEYPGETDSTLVSDRQNL